MITETTNITAVPEEEITITYSRSSGAGGQNVNKTSTKAILRWSVMNSKIFSNEEKLLICEKLANRLNNEGEIVLQSEEERSQPQNKEIAIARLQELVANALRVPKLRKPTRPTRISRLKRLGNKKIRTQIKSARRTPIEF